MTVFTTDPYAIVQTAGETYIGDGTDQVYSINPAMIQAGEVVTIIDQGGTNAIELNAGLEITESIVSNNELVLTLSNGAIVNVRGADTFTFNVGQNQAGGDNEGTELEFADFAQDILGVTLPAEGEAPVEGGASTVNDDGTADVTPVGTPSLSIDDVSVTEGDADTTTATFTVTLSEAPGAGETVTVDYATEDGTATAGDDYVAATGSLTFAEGETTQTIEVTVNGDTEFEADETFNVVLDESSIVGTIGGEAVVISDGTGAGTITNDDEEAVAGETITLTTATDVVGPDGAEGFATTANDDTIEGVASTLSSARTLNPTDEIDGGDGADTLAVDMQGNFTGFTGDGGLQNVETVELTNEGSIDRTFNATGVEGVETYAIDAGGAAVNLADLMLADAQINLASQADGNFDVAFDTASDVVDDTDDALYFNATDVGTEGNAVVATIADIEELHVDVTGTNYIDFDSNDATDMVVTGDGDLTIAQLSTALETFNASAATGDVAVDLDGTSMTNASTGSGDDTVTVVTEDMQINGQLDGGTGADELVLTGDGTEDTLAYNMGGFETVSLGDVGAALLFSATNVTGIETIEITDDLNNDVDFVNMGSADIAFELGEQANNVTVTSNHSGTATVNMTASDDAIAAETYEDADTVITANSAGALMATVNEYANFSGTLNANGASSLEIEVDGTLTGAVISSTGATGAVLTTGEDASTMDLIAASLTDLAVTAGGDLDIDDNATDLTALESLTVDTAGKFEFSNGTNNLESIAIVNLSGAGADAEVDFSGVTLGDGATNDYNMGITASGLTGGLTLNDIDVAAGQNITIDLENLTGVLANAGTGIGSNTAGSDVTISTDGATENTTFGTIDATGAVDITAGSTGTFTVGNIGAGIDAPEDVIIYAWDNLGAVTYGTVEVQDSVTFTGSEVKTNTLTITGTNTDSTTLDVELNSGVQDDTYVINGGDSQTKITITGESAGGTDTLTVNSATGGAEDVTVDASGLSGIEATINGGTDVNTLTGGDADDTLVTGGGSDELTGNDGDDTFEITVDFGATGVEITDFETAEDEITIARTASVNITLGSIAAVSLLYNTTAAGIASQSVTLTVTLGAGGYDSWLVQGSDQTAALAAYTAPGNTLATGSFRFFFLDTSGTDQGLYLLTGSITAVGGTSDKITGVTVTNTVTLVLTGTNDIVASDITFV